MVVRFFMGKGDSIKESRDKTTAEPELVEVTKAPKDSETFNYISTLCPYCDSPYMKKAILEKADNSEQRKTIGYKKKYLFKCEACNSTWFALEK